MHRKLEQNIENLLENGYTFSTGDYISEGFDLFKRNAGLFIGFMILSFFLSLIAGAIPKIGVFLNSLVISPILAVGYFIVADKIKRNRDYDFGTFFEGFQHALPLILATIIMTIIFIIAFSPSLYSLYNSGIFDFYTAILENPLDIPDFDPIFSSNALTVLVLNSLIIWFLIVCYTWTTHFIVFYGLDPWSAMEASRKIIMKRWFAVFGLYLAFFGIFLIGMLISSLTAVMAPLLGVFVLIIMMLGILFVGLPTIYCSIYAAFADVIGFLDDDETDIYDHFVK